MKRCFLKKLQKKMSHVSIFILLQAKVDQEGEKNQVLRAKRTELKAFQVYMKARLARALLQESLGHVIG